MSYILDALRRADAERERGHVPGIHAQPTRIAPTPAVVARPAARRWLLAAMALPVLLLLAWLTWRVAANNDAGTAVPPALPMASLPTAAPAPALPVPALAPAVTQTSTASRSVVPTGGPQSPTEAPGLAPTRMATAPIPAKKTLPASTAGGVRPSRSTLAASSDASPSNPVPAPAPAKVFGVDELPDEIRRDLPKLAIGGSTYSESSASRFLIVNGQLFHEGDTLAPGLVLQQIKQRSAVLGFRGYRYAITL